MDVAEARELTTELLDAWHRLGPQLSRSAPALDAESLGFIVASPAVILLVARLAGRPATEHGHAARVAEDANAPRADTSGVDDEAGQPRSGLIVGSLALACFPIPTGVRAWIEDVVVDEYHRGRGVARALMGAALDRAREAGARTVDLTSRPSRHAANQLYLSLGFTPRETNVYRIDLGDKPPPAE
ncbi:MAG: GNAT family N-acetyltransferase [Acidimicrobiales bacterium]